MIRSERVPDPRIIQNRYFTVRDLMFTLRDLTIGIDNAEFKRLWYEGIIEPPTVFEPEYVAWTYAGAKRLIQDVYKLKGREKEFDVLKMDMALVEKKEIKRYRREMNAKYFTKGLTPPY